MLTQEFRRRVLTARYADPDRAAANFGTADPAVALADRLARDDLWDAELRRQTAATGLPTVTVDGAGTPVDLATELAGRFRLNR